MAELDHDVTADVTAVLPEEEIRVCLFRIGEDTYAIPVDFLTEIILSPKILPVPTTPSHVLGIINLRGMIVPIVDISPALSLPPLYPYGRIAIVKQGTISLGIVVDSVSEVVGIPVSRIQTISADYGARIGANRSRLLKGIVRREAGAAALLDMERVFDAVKLA